MTVGPSGEDVLGHLPSTDPETENIWMNHPSSELRSSDELWVYAVMRASDHFLVSGQGTSSRLFRDTS